MDLCNIFCGFSFSRELTKSRVMAAPFPSTGKEKTRKSRDKSGKSSAASALTAFWAEFTRHKQTLAFFSSLCSRLSKSLSGLSAMPSSPSKRKRVTKTRIEVVPDKEPMLMSPVKTRAQLERYDVLSSSSEDESALQSSPVTVSSIRSSPSIKDTPKFFREREAKKRMRGQKNPLTSTPCATVVPGREDGPEDSGFVTGSGLFDDLDVSDLTGETDLIQTPVKKFKPSLTSTVRAKKRPVFPLDRTRKKRRSEWGECSWDLAMAKNPGLRDYVESRQELDQQLDALELSVVKDVTGGHDLTRK